MLIKWNKSNIHAFGSYDGKQINFLRPGWNEFPSAIFELYKNDTEVLRFIKNKTLELMAEKVTLKTSSGKKVTKVIGQGDDELSLKDLSEEKAIEIVKGTFNRELLQRWTDEENRHKVKRELDKQTKPLLPENKTATA